MLLPEDIFQTQAVVRKQKETNPKWLASPCFFLADSLHMFITALGIDQVHDTLLR